MIVTVNLQLGCVHLWVSFFYGFVTDYKTVFQVEHALSEKFIEVSVMLKFTIRSSNSQKVGVVYFEVTESEVRAKSLR